ncbi:PepSY-associated TM helix domain-containing protein [Sphingomonas sanxanigenens]|uniref:PepSY domain-containing protein n=1 Tax=Sphingomonas sanxanigenens DSM 19645 = NX02 TaxID=1123269 RepID=W0AIK8_9SPHN|nr:PepSY-associated TM helix domain-containing protein [Sphingomonas sanxanigenens]AHE56402.1 hypothetical protein NX02_23960 [Sphingomonas sanxanigenens DSM 19645 = NX02]
MQRARWGLRLWHRGFGIGAGLWLLLLALTGTAIAFYDELDRALVPELRTIPGEFTALPRVDLALATAQVRHPGFVPRHIDLPNRPRDSIMIIGSENGQAAQLFSDPRDGAMLGLRSSGSFAFDRRHLMDTLYALHMDLLLGPTMAWVLGLVALLWAIDHVPAAILAIPRLARWWRALRVKPRGRRALYDRHRAPGLWLMPVTLMLAVSGLCLSWQEETRAVVSLVSPVSERLHYDFPDAPVPSRPIGVDRALARVRGAGVWRVDSVQILPAKAVYAVRAFDERDLDGIGRRWIYVAMADGRILAERHDNGSSAGDAFFAWQYPLHSGKALGLAGRALICIAGLVTASLCLTGIALLLLRTSR